MISSRALKLFTAIAIIFGLSAGIGQAQPVVTQISNAASASLSLLSEATATREGTWLSLPNASIAQGAYFTVYGSGFGWAAATCGVNYVNCSWSSYPLPQTVAETSISITVGSATVMPYINLAVNFGSYSQINAVLPSTIATGTGTLTVTYNGTPSAAVPITVAASTFGAFAVTQAGSGPAVVFDVQNKVITPFNTAKPGDVVVLWGTGLGPPPDIATEQTAPPTQKNLCGSGAACPVTVWVGGQQAAIQYAGRSGYTAIDQINFVVPTNVPAGCYVSVAVQTQTGNTSAPQVTSNFTTMSVDPNGAACSDANGVSMNYINGVLAAKGYADVGVISLTSQLWNIDVGGGAYAPMPEDVITGTIAKFGPTPLEFFEGFTESPSVNNCTANAYLGYPPPTDYGLGYATYLDAGAALSAENPSATKASVPELMTAAGAPDGYYGVVGGCSPIIYSGCPIDGGPGWAYPLFFWNSTSNGDGTYTVTNLISGNYTVTAPGGADVGPFTASLDVSGTATSLDWTNAANFQNLNGESPTISRGTPLNITWSGGDPAGYVDITLIGSTALFTFPFTGPQQAEPGMQVECIVPTTLGSFNVPTYVLQALPSYGDSGSDLQGVVLVGPIGAPVKISPTPSGLDALYMFYSLTQGYTVKWQ